MTQQERIFITLSPTRLFFRCALPSMVSMAVTSLYTVVDGIFVGRYVGADALAAVNLVMPLLLISFALIDLVAVGSSVQIAIRLGEQKSEEASRIFTCGSMLCWPPLSCSFSHWTTICASAAGSGTAWESMCSPPL